MRYKLLLLLTVTILSVSLHAQRNNKGVTLYKDCNYNGSNVSLGLGSYNTNEMGIGNDALSSLRISSGYTVTLYESASFSGKSTVYKDDVSCLSSSWNDKVSSIRITRERDDDNGNGNNNGVVTLYQDCSYKGVSKSLGIGYHKVTELGIDNDALSSIRVNRGYMITVYVDDNFRGTSTSFYDDVSCLSSSWNDKVSSVYIARENGNGNNNGGGNNGGGYGGGGGNQKVTLYEDCNYNGAHNSLGVGYYDLVQLGIKNDALSSLTIPPGYSVTVYKDDRQKGVQTTYTANTPCLPGSWNDKVSSIRVFRTGY